MSQIHSKVVLDNIKNVEKPVSIPLQEKSTQNIYRCPLCGWDKFTNSPYNKVLINGQDLDIRMYCFRCVWRGRRSELDIIEVERDGPNYDT